MAYVSNAVLRTLPNLADTAKFTDAELTAASTWFETAFEEYTGVAFETRTVTDERHYLTSAGVLILDHLYPRTVSAVRSYSAAATSTAYTVDELADLHVDPSGIIRRVRLGPFTSSWGLVALDYTHAKATTPPADVVEAAKAAIRAKLVDDQTGNRVFAVQNEAGIIRSSSPGDGRPFGIPFVDEVANRRRERTPAVA